MTGIQHLFSIPAKINGKFGVAQFGRNGGSLCSGICMRNWEKLSTYFKYPEAIRRLIYTTNTIEGYHCQIRKVTKTKGAFTTDMALLKLIYLATQNIQKKWTMPLANWSITVSQQSIIFAGRLTLNI